DDDRYTNTGGDGQLLNNANINKHQRQETHTITQQCQHARHIQTTKRMTGGLHIVGAFTRFNGNAVNNLHAVGNTNGEYQKRHQHPIRINGVTQPAEYTQLPDHRNQRRHNGNGGTARATGIKVEQKGDHQNGCKEEIGNGYRTVEQITEFFRRTGDVNLIRTAFAAKLSPDLIFQIGREFLIAQTFTGFRIKFGQRYVNNGRTEIVGDQTADLTRLQDILPYLLQAFGAAIVGAWHHRPTPETFFGHFGPAGIRRPYGLHGRAVNPFNEEHLIVNFAQGFHVFAGKNVTLLGFNGNFDVGHTAFHIIGMHQIILDIFMLQRNVFFDTGIQFGFG